MITTPCENDRPLAHLLGLLRHYQVAERRQNGDLDSGLAGATTGLSRR